MQTKPKPMTEAAPASQPGHSGTDWNRLKTMTDDDIARAVARDPDAAPILPEEEMRRRYKPAPPRIKR